MTTFFIIRHGQTEGNLHNILQGQSDSPLTPLGLEQAKKLSEKLKDIHFDAIFSSDTGRAKKTAEIICKSKGLKLTTSPLLRERSFGQYEGRDYTVFTAELADQMESFDKLSDIEKRKYHYPTMESDQEVIDRVMTLIKKLLQEYPNGNILLVTHSGLITYLLLELGFLDYSNKSNYNISQESYLILETDGKKFELTDTSSVIKNN